MDEGKIANHKTAISQMIAQGENHPNAYASQA